MTLTLEVYDSESSTWLDKMDSCVSLRRRIRSNGLEELNGELVKDNVSVGREIRLKEDGNIVFEGVVYEVDRRHRGRDVERCGFKAYDYLIKYDRHVVYRLYQTGTKAGEIIKDLASLESGVDASNVDNGDSLLSPWEIENEKALDIMKSVARGVNYWLRMKPGKLLYFKPKQVGTSTATITDQIVLDAEYSEDRWKLKNRVIYVGADGEILADVSEGSGDLPVVVHDPYLTSKEEAQRRANIRLALNKEYGRSLRITMHQADFKNLGIDLGDTCTINLPSVGLSNVDMVLLGIEYDPKSLKYRLEFGGRRELLEDWLDEKIGGDVAARFGKAMTLPEQTSTLAYSLDKIARIQADQKHVLYVSKPPITLYNAENIILNSDGEAELASGATEGSFETQILPPSELFINYIKAEWIAEKSVKRENVFPSSLSGWQYRKKITIQENAGQSLTNYQIRLTIHYGSGIDGGSDIYLDSKCKTDFGDIRFTKDDGETLLDYWMEEKVDSDYAVFWVKVPSIPANGTTDIYIYYGKSDAAYAGSGYDVFEFFDDFVEDISGWEIRAASGDGSYSKVDDTLKHDPSPDYSSQGSGTTTTWKNLAVLAKFKRNANGLTAVLGDYHGAGITVRGGSSPSKEGHFYRLKITDTKVGIDCRDTSATWSSVCGYSRSHSADTWYVYQLAACENTLKVLDKDGSVLCSAINTKITSDGWAGTVASKSAIIYVDYFAVRKYVDPEPSITSIGGEEYHETTAITGEVSAEFLNGDGESLGQVYDAYDTQFYRFMKWPNGYGSFTYKNSSSFGANNASISDVRMGILHAYCLKLTPDSLGSDGEIYYPSSKDLNLGLSWAKWLRLYLYADYENNVTIKIRLHQDASNYFEASLTVKAKEWRKYELSMGSLSQVGSPSLSNINWISIISPYPILIDSDHVFLPAVRELMRAKFTLKRDSPDDPSPKLKLVKLIWREGA